MSRYYCHLEQTLYLFFFFYIIKNTWVLFAHKRKCFPIIFHPIHIIFISYSLWNTSRYLLSHYFDQHCGHSSWSLSTLQALFLLSCGRLHYWSQFSTLPWNHFATRTPTSSKQRDAIKFPSPWVRAFLWLTVANSVSWKWLCGQA